MSLIQRRDTDLYAKRGATGYGNGTKRIAAKAREVFQQLKTRFPLPRPKIFLPYGQLKIHAVL
jgi:hypothetical protein